MLDINNISATENVYSANSDNDSFISVPSLVDRLNAQFSDVPKKFNVIHISDQSIPAC